MKKILLTGASGFLGSRIASFYAQKYEIYTPAHAELDITDEGSVRRMAETYRPDVVIHCAAVSDVGQCEKEPERSWKINVNGSINLAKAAGDVQAKCMICSSDQVYFGSSFSGAHREEEALSPCNLYGQEKLRAEQECLRANPDCVLLRLSWMYDVKTGKEGEHSDFFRTLISQIAGEEAIKLPVWDRRGITDVNEVAKHLEKAFELPGGVYNFGSPNEKSTYETVRGVFENLGLNTDRLQKNEEAFRGNPRNLTMCQEKINSQGIFFSDTADSLARQLAGLDIT
ncbi:sugar nucleotide-binding protein [Lachnospiraceae bacterium KK002]